MLNDLLLFRSECNCHTRFFRPYATSLKVQATGVKAEGQTIAEQGDDSRQNLAELRKQAGDRLTPADIFVVEWVEVGQVCELRKAV